MKNKRNSQGSTRVWVSLLAIVAFAGLSYILIKKDKSPTDQYTEVTTDGNIKQQKIAPEQIPSEIPKDMPFMSTETVSENFTKSSDKKAQSVRRWKVAQSQESVLLAYQTYFQNNGWELVSTYDDTTTALVGMKKGEISLSLTVIKEGSAESTIEIATNKTL